ncbi:hypothetical protein [Rhodococcus sp. NPDC058514]|uniref:hypothetical protein n=1 Tax=unclassified Rhodococcus (in: high G+C Gram-positive bacteria) TaxID=192944 RepID=UPI00364F891A
MTRIGTTDPPAPVAPTTAADTTHSDTAIPDVVAALRVTFAPGRTRPAYPPYTDRAIKLFRRMYRA